MSTSINYKYYIDSDYEPHYVNGVYGGVNISGELVANFYFERLPNTFHMKNKLKWMMILM